MSNITSMSDWFKHRTNTSLELQLEYIYTVSTHSYLKFAVSGIHDKHDSIHSEGGLSDVCGDDAFPHTIWSLTEDELKGNQLRFPTCVYNKDIKCADINLLEDLGLEVRRQLGVDGQHGQSRSVLQVLQPLHNLIRRHLQPRR